MKAPKLILLTVVLVSLLVVATGCSDRNPAASVWDATAQGDLKLVKRYLDAGADVNQTLQVRVAGYGGTLLHIAALADQKEIGKLLLDRGANIEAKATDANEGTPLHWAAFAGRRAFCEFLVQAGADVNSRDVNGYTPLDAALGMSHLAVAEFLRLKGGKTRAELSPSPEGN
jgi:ankyrin repeat protein